MQFIFRKLQRKTLPQRLTASRPFIVKSSFFGGESKVSYHEIATLLACPANVMFTAGGREKTKNCLPDGKQP